jgi:hypothetical protein
MAAAIPLGKFEDKSFSRDNSKNNLLLIQGILREGNDSPALLVF